MTSHWLQSDAITTTLKDILFKHVSMCQCERRVSEWSSYTACSVSNLWVRLPGDRGEQGDKGVKGYGPTGYTGDEGPKGNIMSHNLILFLMIWFKSFKEKLVYRLCLAESELPRKSNNMGEEMCCLRGVCLPKKFKLIPVNLLISKICFNVNALFLGIIKT